MALVNKFSYPPVTVVDVDERNHMIGKEQQLALVSLYSFTYVHAYSFNAV